MHILLSTYHFQKYSTEQNIQNKKVIPYAITCLINANKDPYISSSI